MASIDPPFGLDDEVFFGPVTQRELIITWRKRRQERMDKERNEALKEQECALSREEPDVKKPHIELEEHHSDLTVTDNEQLPNMYSNSSVIAGQAYHQSQDSDEVSSLQLASGQGGNPFQIDSNCVENVSKAVPSSEEVSISGNASEIQELMSSPSTTYTNCMPEVSECLLEEHDEPLANEKSEVYEDAMEGEASDFGNEFPVKACPESGERELERVAQQAPEVHQSVVLNEEKMLTIDVNPKLCGISEEGTDNTCPSHNCDKVCSSLEEKCGAEDHATQIEQSCIENPSKEVSYVEHVSSTNVGEIQEELISEYRQPNNVSPQFPTNKADYPRKDFSVNRKSVEFENSEQELDAELVHVEPKVHLSGAQNGEDESSTHVKPESCEMLVEGSDNTCPSHNCDKVCSSLEEKCGAEDHAPRIEQSCIENPSKQVSYVEHVSSTNFGEIQEELISGPRLLLPDCETRESQCLIPGVKNTLANDKSVNYEDAVEEYRQPNNVSPQFPTNKDDYPGKDFSVNRKSVEFENSEQELDAELLHVEPNVHLSGVQNGEDESSTHVKPESCEMLVEGSDNTCPSHNCDKVCSSLEEKCGAEDHAPRIEQSCIENPSKEVSDVEHVSSTNVGEIQEELISGPRLLLPDCETRESQCLIPGVKNTLANDKSVNYEDAVEEYRQPNNVSPQFPTNKDDYPGKDFSVNRKSVEFENSEQELDAELLHVEPNVHLSGVQNGEDESSTHVKPESCEMLVEGSDNTCPSHNCDKVCSSLEEKCGAEDHAPRIEQSCIENPSKEVSDVEHVCSIAKANKIQEELISSTMVLLTDCESEVEETSAYDKSENYEDAKEEYRQSDVSIQSTNKDVSVNEKSAKFVKSEPQLVAEQVHVVPGVENGEDESSTHFNSESYNMLVEVCDNGRPSHICDQVCTSLGEECRTEEHVSLIKQSRIENASNEAPFVEQVSFTANVSEIQEKSISSPVVLLTDCKSGEPQCVLPEVDETLANDKSENYEDAVEEYHQPNDVPIQSPTEFEKSEPELVAEYVVSGVGLSGVQNEKDESSTHLKSESHGMLVEDVGQLCAVVVGTPSKTSAEEISMQDKKRANQEPGVHGLNEDQTLVDVAYQSGTRQVQRHQNLNNTSTQQESTTDDVPITHGPEENKENGPALVLSSLTVKPEILPAKTIDTPHAGTLECPEPAVTVPKSNIPKHPVLKPATFNVDPSSLNTAWVKRLNMSKIPKPKRPCYVQPLDK